VGFEGANFKEMTRRLERRYGFGHHHFVTFSCYRRLPYLAEPAARNVFESSLETMRRKYGFQIDSYIVMPEHIHLLVSEPYPPLRWAVKGLRCHPGSSFLRLACQAPSKQNFLQLSESK
jgi:hypothetical protein